MSGLCQRPKVMASRQIAVGSQRSMRCDAFNHREGRSITTWPVASPAEVCLSGLRRTTFRVKVDDMKAVAALLFLLATAFQTWAGERVVLYATLLESTPVDLSDGSKWQMDKGDCFPIVAYKESHTLVILQLASASFAVPAAKTRVLTDKEIPAAIVSYRGNVNTYINGFAARWRAAAEAGKPE
jgi:hypothetical protein